MSVYLKHHHRMSYRFGFYFYPSRMIVRRVILCRFIRAFRFKNFQSLFIHFNDTADVHRLRGVYMDMNIAFISMHFYLAINSGCHL